MQARARFYKRGRRWHWYLIVIDGAGHARVYSGNEVTWGLAFHMAELTYQLHKRSDQPLDRLAAVA